MLKYLLVLTLLLGACGLEDAGTEAAGAAGSSPNVAVKAEAFTYFSINSNGGALLSSEGSTKKAALRGIAMYDGTGLGGNYWECPSGTDCYHGYNGGGVGGTPSTQQHLEVTNCLDTVRCTSCRVCDVYRNGQKTWAFVYAQGTPSIEVWKEPINLYPSVWGHVEMNQNALIKF